jgi:hypothetical protein
VKLSRYVALALLAALVAANCYRAATQSLTHDEALTWGLYLAGPAARIFDFYDPNHHFLGTLLEKFITSVFGFSELALRLPSLAAGALYFLVACRLSVFLFGEGLLFLLTVAVLSAHPLVLDFLVAARGYGLALALFLWGLFELLRYQTEEDHQRQRLRLVAGSCGLSLAVWANLTLLFPVLALALVFLLTARFVRGEHEPPSAAQPKPGASRKKRDGGPKPARAAERKPPGRFRWFVLPAVGWALLMILTMPMEKARADQLYVGVASPAASLENLVRLSLAHNPGPLDLDWGQLAVGLRVVMWGAPVVVMAALARGWVAFRRQRRGGAPPSGVEQMLLMVSGTAAGSVLLLAAAHHGYGLPYPVDRTGLYFLPLATLCLAGLGVGVRLRLLGFAHAAVLMAFAVQWLLQWNITHFQVWRYDADTKAVFRRIEADSGGRKPPIRVGASWMYLPALEYYRNRGEPARFAPIAPNPDGDFDYYMLEVRDRKLVASRNLRVIYRGPVSEAVLAVPASR